jgi:hypothetical protein
VEEVGMRAAAKEKEAGFEDVEEVEGLRGGVCDGCTAIGGTKPKGDDRWDVRKLPSARHWRYIINPYIYSPCQLYLLLVTKPYCIVTSC